MRNLPCLPSYFKKNKRTLTTEYRKKSGIQDIVVKRRMENGIFMGDKVS